MQSRTTHIRAFPLFVCLTVSLGFVIAASTDAGQELRSFSDDELREALRESNGKAEEQETLLTEVIRRGGEQWELCLRALIDDQKARSDKWKQYSIGRIQGQKTRHDKPVPKVEVRQPPDFVSDRYIALLTALRRIQNKPDPLTVLIAGKLTVNCKIGSLPTMHVLLTNLDVDRGPVAIQDGGDYRSGRLARWRFVVRDASGHELPQKMPRGPMGGGISSDDILEYGESWTVRLRMADYVDVFVPGQYTVQILYHDEIAVADREHVDGLIVCRSLPLRLIVDPIEVEISQKGRQAVRRYIRALPTAGPVKILRGPFNERAHDFISPDSSCGRLLALGWGAVPDLIEAAIDPQLDPARRAQVLAILFSVTSHNDPQLKGVLGPYEYRGSGWTFMGEPTDGAMSNSTQSKSVRTGNIDAKAQMEFAERWRVWVKEGYIQVKQGSRLGEADRR